jgi:hydroxymethylbilane synthase
VLDGRADLAQHSAKDLPALTPVGLVLAAVPERADVRDALVGSTFAALPVGGRVATGSVRRRAQLAAARPDLTFAELRGNVDTRLAKASEHDAIVLAAAGLDRLGLGDRITERLDTTLMLPMVGQGALAVECRADDSSTLERLAAIDDPDAHAAVDAERAYLARLGGGCTLPCAALATVNDKRVSIEALLATLDGSVVVRAHAEAADPTEAGDAVAQALFDRGGRELLRS